MARILVVEDDKTMNKLVSTYLRDNGYYDFRMEIEYLGIIVSLMGGSKNESQSTSRKDASRKKSSNRRS